MSISFTEHTRWLPKGWIILISEADWRWRLRGSILAEHFTKLMREGHLLMHINWTLHNITVFHLGPHNLLNSFNSNLSPLRRGISLGNKLIIELLPLIIFQIFCRRKFNSYNDHRYDYRTLFISSINVYVLIIGLHESLWRLMLGMVVDGTFLQNLRERVINISRDILGIRFTIIYLYFIMSNALP